MATRRWILFLLTATLIAALAGCNSGSTFNVQNPAPPPPAAGISIAFQPAPPASVQVGSTATITAAVSNDPDPSKDGVDWTLTCSTGNCGSLSATYTGCAAPSNCQAGTPSYTTSVTYYPPASLPGNSEIVNIAGYAIADPTKNVLASITVTGFGNNLQAGNYVLQAQGVDSNGGPNYQFAGVIHLDGNGNITSGEQTVDFYDNALATPALVSKPDPITKGSYFLGPDGRGTITINTADKDIGGTGTETFTFVYLNSSQALIAQNDFVGAATGASATGTMDLQNSAAITAAPTGSYAFVASGLQITLPSTSGLTSPSPVALGGILNIDSPNTISGIYSVMDDVLPNQLGTAPVISSAKQPSGSVSTPDAFGMVTLNLTVPFVRTSPSPIQFTGYIVDATHIKLIESDNTPTNPNPPFGSTAGLAIAQASPALGNFSVASIAGPYVFGVTGTDLANFNTIPDTLTSAGMFYADGGGGMSNDNGTPADGDFMDMLLQANTYLGSSGSCNVNGNTPAGAQISATFGGTYTIDSAGIGSTGGIGGAGIGRVKASLNSFNPQPLCGGFSSQFLLYLTGDVTNGYCPADTADNGNCPALVVAVGNANYPFIGTGIAYPQASSPTFPPINTGFSFTQYSSSGEEDGTAQMTAAPNATPPSSSGIADNSINGVNLGFGGTYDPSGCFITAGSNLVAVPNCYPGTLSSGSSAFQTDLNQISVHFYVIDGSLGNPGGFFVETDWLEQMEAGVSTPQVSFGYFAAQCPINSPTPCPPPPQQGDKRGRVLRK